MFSDAQKLYVLVGNIEGQAQILVDFARIKEEQGQLEAARSLIKESLLLRENMVISKGNLNAIIT